VDILKLIVSPPCTCEEDTARYYVCATLVDSLGNSSVCCDTISFPYKCCGPRPPDFDYRLASTVSIDSMKLFFSLSTSSIPSDSLRVSIVDSFGITQMVVFDDVLPSLFGEISASLLGLPYGLYDVVCEFMGDVAILPIMFVDSSIVDYVSVFPTIVESSLNVSYGLTRSTSSSLRISLVNFRGDELVEVYNAVPSISGELSVDLSSYITGIYFLVFSIYDDVLRLPIVISRSIIKQ
jgi:hypothetical protein